MNGCWSLGFLAAVGMLSITSTFAHAKSCTEQGRECTNWAVLVGNQYPIDTCN